MGGKTQQRVSGNVKPSNSGRIRELLINKNGAGNVITFSTLSSTNPVGLPPQANKAILDPGKPRSPTQPEKQQIKTRPALVVKKIGNRECFTRLMLTDDTPNPFPDISNVQKYTDGNEPASLNEVINNDSAAEKELELPSERAEQIDGESIETESANEQQDEQEQQEQIEDFDAFLDKICEVKALANQVKVSSISDLTDEDLNHEHELLKILKISIRQFKYDLSIEEWDLVTASIDRWIQLTSKSLLPFVNVAQSKFCSEVLSFISLLISLAKSLKDIENLEEHPMLQSILEDWNNFHSTRIYREIVATYFRLISSESISHNDNNQAILKESAKIILDVDSKFVLINENLIMDHLKLTTELENDSDLPLNGRYCEIDRTKFKGLLVVFSLMKSNQRMALIPAHTMLMQAMDRICINIQDLSDLSDQYDSENTLLFPPVFLTAILTSRDTMMSLLLSDYRAGDISVTMEPNTDSYGCTLSYLLVWDLVIQFIVGIDKEFGHRIIHSLKKLGLFQRLLDSIFMLLPPLGEKNSLSLTMPAKGTSQKEWTLREFLKSPLKTNIERSSNEIELVALHIYFSVALHMPETVRKWFNNNSNKRLCNLVNEYTVKHISQVICALELDTVQEKCQQRASQNGSNNLVIKARPSAKEVYAIYIRDEFKMELTIKLPVNYPLGPVQIDGGKRVGVTDLKWRSWLLQLTTFLSHQNGPILDGIELWRRNIDKRFEGIEKCTICFSILHSNYQLPKKKCQTCTKMFHNLCLYKWFESSGNSTCPLCRNPW